MGRQRWTVVPVSELSKKLSEAAAGRPLDAVVELTVKAGHPLSRSLVNRLLNGSHGPKTTDDTLLAMAAALDLDVRDLRELAGRPRGAVGKYEPTEEAGSLTEYQRKAMDELIRAIVRGEQDGRRPEAEKSSSGTGGGATVTELRQRPTEETLRPDTKRVASRPSAEERARRKAEQQELDQGEDENQDPDA